jgi:uncharacterized protein (TIGR03437 family)
MRGGGDGIRWPLDDRTEGISSAELIEARKKKNPDALIPAEIAQPTGPWYHLRRLSNRARNYNLPYQHRNLGAYVDGPFSRIPVDIYFMDTGINLNLTNEFNNRATLAANAFPPAMDCTGSDGHGTIVASAAAGFNWGVSPESNIIMYRVVDCSEEQNSAPVSTIIYYLELIKARVAANRPRGAILNLSIQLPYTSYGSTVRAALQSLIYDYNVPVFCGAGQFNNPGSSTDTNYLHYWPQNVPNVMNVGMTDAIDRRVNYSYTCNGSTFSIVHSGGVNIFAPAGPWYTDPFNISFCGVRVMNASGASLDYIGTSIASALASGVVAQFIAMNKEFYPKWHNVSRAIVDSATNNALSNLDGQPNKLLYNYQWGSAFHAASYRTPIGRGTFGANFAPTLDGLPNEVRIVKDDGAEILAWDVNYVGDGQTNFRVPDNLTLGEGVYGLKLANNNTPKGYGLLNLKYPSPGVYSLNGNGKDAAVAQLWVYDKQTNALLNIYNIPAAGVSWDPNVANAYLIVYGTGWAYHISNNAVQLKKQGGSTIFTHPGSFQLLYMGATNGVAPNGLDQVNIGPLPAAIKGTGTYEFKLYVCGTAGVNPVNDAYLANITTVKFN